MISYGSQHPLKSFNYFLNEFNFQILNGLYLGKVHREPMFLSRFLAARMPVHPRMGSEHGGLHGLSRDKGRSRHPGGLSKKSELIEKVTHFRRNSISQPSYENFRLVLNYTNIPNYFTHIPMGFWGFGVLSTLNTIVEFPF